MALLEIISLKRHFGGVHALDGADLSVQAGTLTGLIGPNGAGKSTLFNVISGFVPSESGLVRFDGEDITGWRADRITRRGVVRTFQIPRGFAQMSVMENLLVYGPGQPGEGLLNAVAASAAARQSEAALIARARLVAEKLNLSGVLDNRAIEISGGQKKLLEIGRALMAGPKMILLDEPMAGVNPALAETIAAHLRSLIAEGLTLLLIEHNMGMIARLCDPVIVMAQGRHLMTGSFEQIASNQHVQEVYMGKRAKRA